MVIFVVVCDFFCGIEETGNSYHFSKSTLIFFIKLSNDVYRIYPRIDRTFFKEKNV